MFSPNELEEISFERAFMGGYKLNEVEEFVNKISADYIKLFNENEDLKKKLKIVVDKVESYRSKESLISEALLSAQSLKDNAAVEADKIVSDANIKIISILSDAEKEAKIISEKAVVESDLQIEKIKTQINNETEKLNAIKKEVSDFKGKIQELYKSHLTSIMTLPNYDGPVLESKKEEKIIHEKTETDNIPEEKIEILENQEEISTEIAEEKNIETNDEKTDEEFEDEKKEDEIKKNEKHKNKIEPLILDKNEQQTIFKKDLSGIFDFDQDKKINKSKDSMSFVLKKKDN